mmetsp:Transcript_129128/g.373770  ORF Transcript_129128/g.373770 Transcript_129128/m.373770 type:complete len:204 (+) Transcript_129128:1250-1861(+)
MCGVARCHRVDSVDLRQVRHARRGQGCGKATRGGGGEEGSGAGPGAIDVAGPRFGELGDRQRHRDAGCEGSAGGVATGVHCCRLESCRVADVRWEHLRRDTAKVVLQGLLRVRQVGQEAVRSFCLDRGMPGTVFAEQQGGVATCQPSGSCCWRPYLQRRLSRWRFGVHCHFGRRRCIADRRHWTIGCGWAETLCGVVGGLGSR